MNYWTGRTQASGYHDGYRYTVDNISLIRQHISNPDRGRASRSAASRTPRPTTRSTAWVTVRKSKARSGWSMYDWNTTAPHVDAGASAASPRLTRCSTCWAGSSRSCRGAGSRSSLTENLDAMEAVKHIPIEDRDAFKYALAATLVKNNAHWRAFETVFEVYFSLRGQEYAVDGDGEATVGARRASSGRASSGRARRRRWTS